MAKWPSVKCTRTKKWKRNASAAIIWARCLIITWSECNFGAKNVGGMHTCCSIHDVTSNYPNCRSQMLSNCHWPRVGIVCCQCRDRSSAVFVLRTSGSCIREVCSPLNSSISYANWWRPVRRPYELINWYVQIVFIEELNDISIIIFSVPCRHHKWKSSHC